MNIGLSMNKIKELAGGGASGVTPWREHASAKGTGQITLPSKWTEIKIVTCNSSGLACFSSTLTYEEYQNNVAGKNYFTTFEGYNDSNFAKWCCYPKYVYLEDYHYASDQTTSCTTTVYYKEVLENVVNIGTESQWELWGSATGQGEIILPNDWEELYICSYTNKITRYINITKDIFINNMQGTYFYLDSGLPDGSDYYYTKWKIFKENKICLIVGRENMTSIVDNFTTTVYYKKKCDNVLDINDMGEWKLQGSATGDDEIVLPENYKELYITSVNASGINYAILLTKEFMEDLKVNAKSVATIVAPGGTDSSSQQYIYRRTNNSLAFSGNISSFKNNLYYR